MVLTPESIADELRTVARKTIEGDFEPTLAAVAELARPERLTRIVKCVLSHPGWLAYCAPLSFLHVLGFEKFVLVDGQPDFTLRMHVWHPDDDRPLGHIHDHRDYIASAVACGTLEKQIFVRDPAATSFIEYMEEHDEDRWMLHQIGETGLRLAQVIRLKSGSHYELSPDVLHRTRADRDHPTITLFLETAAIRKTTAVFVKDNKAPRRLPKVPLTQEGYRRGLRRALQALQSEATTPA
jgi:hypothetical protein